MSVKILGISAFYHDSAAALAVDGEIVFAMHEERATRRKHDASFPVNAVKACLERGGRYAGGGGPLSIDDLDAVAFYEKPLLKFERLMETYYAFAPRGAAQFLSSARIWAGEKLFTKQALKAGLSVAGPYDGKKLKLLFPEHHLSHAASAFYPSPFDSAAIVTADGAGEWATASICRGSGAGIEMLREQRFPHSLGLLYSAFTCYAGFRVNSGEYKLMGLAPYGDPGRAEKLKEKIYSNLLEVKEDGSIWMNQEYFDYAAGLRMVKDHKWKDLFGFPRREPESELFPAHCDLALAAQQVTEDVMIRLAREAGRLTGSANLCLAGGVALNCAANSALLREKTFRRIWIQPAAGDAGGALGAALAAHHIYFGETRAADGSADRMRGAFLGPEYSDGEIEAAAREAGAVFEKLGDNELFDRTAGLLAAGAVLGWHQGRAEWGPRALGNRSILADARNPAMQERLNLKIKRRESFRPFAPSVLAGDSAEYFEGGPVSPYMLLLGRVKESLLTRLPPDYDSLPPLRKLAVPRSSLPAVTHVDASARLQTVHPETNPRYHRLLEAFKKLTGCGVLLNTSFNVRGEPITCSPADSYGCFMGTGLDYLVIGNYIFDKAAQPPRGT